MTDKINELAEEAKRAFTKEYMNVEWSSNNLLKQSQDDFIRGYTAAKDKGVGMKWVVVKSANDLPELDWEGVIKLNGVSMNSDGAKLKWHYQTKPTQGMEWLDESPSPSGQWDEVIDLYLHQNPDAHVDNWTKEYLKKHIPKLVAASGQVGIDWDGIDQQSLDYENKYWKELNPTSYKDVHDHWKEGFIAAIKSHPEFSAQIPVREEKKESGEK